MELDNITTGHWIFAGISILVFIGVLIWSYRKDQKIHKKHYEGAFKLTVFIIVLIFIIFIFKRLV